MTSKVNWAVVACVGFILAAACISLTWFSEGLMLSGADSFFPYRGHETFAQTFYVWDSRSLGFSNARMVAWGVPHGIFFKTIEALGISLPVGQKIWYYLLMAFTGLSAFFLAWQVLRIRLKAQAALIAGLFYMFNPYVTILVTDHTYLWLTYAALPLKLGLFINGVVSRKKMWFIVPICLIWWACSGSQYVNPKYVILDWLPIFLFLLYYLVAEKAVGERRWAMKFTASLFLFFLIMNLHWIIPFADSLMANIDAVVSAYKQLGRVPLTEYEMNSAPLFEAFRLLGYWPMKSGVTGEYGGDMHVATAGDQGDPILSWSSTYYSALFVFIGYLIFAIAYLPLLFKKHPANIGFFFILAIMALFAMNGAYRPLGYIHLAVIAQFPFLLSGMTLSYVFFCMYLTAGYAVLLAYSITFLYEWQRGRSG